MIAHSTYAWWDLMNSGNLKRDEGDQKITMIPKLLKLFFVLSFENIKLQCENLPENDSGTDQVFIHSPQQ